jgi:hypothetical protein
VHDPAVIETLCDHLVSGLSMEEACALPECPSRTAVYVEMSKNEALRARIARARVDQQDAEIDRTIAMADSATPEDWQVVKLRIWARQWRAAKLAPKIYGDRTQHEHTGTVTLEALVGGSFKQIEQQTPEPPTIEHEPEE